MKLTYPKTMLLLKIFFGGAIISVFYLVSFGQTPNKPQHLLPNKPIERSIKGGETHVFEMELKKGEYTRAEVEQKNIDVVVSLLDADGKLVSEMDGDGGRLWREDLSIIPEKYGKGKIIIKSNGNIEQQGSYEIKIVESGQAKLNDYKRLNAEKYLNLSRELFKENKSDLSIDYLKKSLHIWREINEKTWTAITLYDLAWFYSAISDYKESNDSYLKSQIIFKELDNKKGLGRVLKGLGNLNQTLGNYDLAENFYNQALEFRKFDDDEVGQANIIESLGNISTAKKHYFQAYNYYKNALIIYNKFYIKIGIGNVSNAIALMFQKTNYEGLKGFDLKSQSYTYYKLAPDGGSGISCGSELNSKTNENTLIEVKVLTCLNNALEAYTDIDFKIGIANVYNNLANYYLEIFEDSVRAKKFYLSSLNLHKELKNLIGEGETFYNLMILYHQDNDENNSILFGKQAISALQQIRENIKTFDKNTQSAFLQNNIIVYRTLSNILISEGRFPEAQAILDLLKDEEYTQLTRSGEKPETVPYSQSETQAITKIESLVALEHERTELYKTQRETGTLSKVQADRVEQLRLDIAAANKAFEDALLALGKAEETAQGRVDEIKGGQELQGALTTLAKKTKSGVVALYTVLGTEQAADGDKDKTKTKFGWVIMVREGSYTAYPIDVANLEETVFAFHNALASDKYDPQPLAEKIYTAIFRQPSKQKRTLEEDLRDYFGAQKDKTVMWSLDGVLRYIPMAALHDGENYLVETYRNVVFTKNSIASLTSETEAEWRILGLGVSEKRPDFNALPGVKTELETIVRETGKTTGILNGTIKLNDDFKKQTFLNLLGGGAFPVVHIASHYSFNSTKLDESFLLVGDGHLSFADITKEKNIFGTVDLLTLSACDTGVSGNGKEAEGFAFLAQARGAKSVIASLWKVSDAGTPELMIRFYKLRAENPKMSKGEAFRQAQLSLLNGEKEKNTKNDKTDQRAETYKAGKNEVELPLYETTGKAKFSHPYYWASFVLIGNWR